MTDANISEDELHAYVDGALPADRVAAVEAYLAAHPDEAARVAAWRSQASAIRERYGAVAAEPVPERLQRASVERRAGGMRRRIAAAAVIALCIGVAAGWTARGWLVAEDNRQMAVMLAEAAIEAHRLYINEVRHPIEVRADEAHLLPWLSRRVGSPVRAPDLGDEGFTLMGGRLLPGAKGPTALIMYEGAAGERVTVTCARTKTLETSSFKWRQMGDVGALAWVDAGLGFVVAGPAERERLDRIARRIHAAYEANADGAN